jgi:hypothetical protein
MLSFSSSSFLKFSINTKKQNYEQIKRRQMQAKWNNNNKLIVHDIIIKNTKFDDACYI